MAQTQETDISPETTATLDGGTYEILRNRLLKQGAELRTRLNLLNQSRKDIFGSVEQMLLATERMRGLLSEMEEMFEEDFRNSRLMEEGEYKRKPWWFRFGVRVARLTSPIQ